MPGILKSVDAAIIPCESWICFRAIPPKYSKTGHADTHTAGR